VITAVEVAPGQSDSQPVPNSWTPVTLPDLWKQPASGAEHGLWYRVMWATECPDKPVALAVNRMVMAAQVFINGDLLWQDQSLQKPLSRSWNMPRYWLLPASVVKPENTLLFHLVSEKHPMPGLGTVLLGEPTRVLAEHSQHVWQQRDGLSINVIISTVIAVLFLVIWVMRPKEHALGWFALSSLLWSFGMLNMFLTSPWPFELGTTWDRLSLCALILYACTFTMFVWSFGEMHFPKLSVAIGSVTAVMVGVVVLVPEHYIGQLQLLCTISYRMLFALVCLGFVVHALRTRTSSHLLLGVCMLIYFLLNTYDMLAFLGLLNNFQEVKALSAPLGSVIMFIIVAGRFVSSLRRVECFNDELQAAVTTTRDELTRILKREHELEGDNIRLNERLRFTHDLHDSMGSSLMRSIILTEQTRSLERTQFLSMLKELRNDLRHVIDGSSSTVSADHSTPAVWIAPLRRRFSALFDELDVTTRWSLPEQWPMQIDAMRLLALTRFLEEALTNVLKHSGCNQLEVTLQGIEPKGLSLSVKDNGRGFDAQMVHEHGQGIGMNSMRMRIERIGGHLQISSAPGQTLLIVTLGGESAHNA
jgi:two-component system sensor histidine kinase UhpB